MPWTLELVSRCIAVKSAASLKGEEQGRITRGGPERRTSPSTSRASLRRRLGLRLAEQSRGIRGSEKEP